MDFLKILTVLKLSTKSNFQIAKILRNLRSWKIIREDGCVREIFLSFCSKTFSEQFNYEKC